MNCRLSDDDEKDGTSVSIETQEKLLTDFCKKNNICIYDVYIDDGFTGTNFNRPDFKRMMEDVKAKRVNVVVVKDYCEIMGLNQKDLENKAFWLSPFFF